LLTVCAPLPVSATAQAHSGPGATTASGPVLPRHFSKRWSIHSLWVIRTRLSCPQRRRSRVQLPAATGYSLPGLQLRCPAVTQLIWCLDLVSATEFFSFWNGRPLLRLRKAPSQTPNNNDDIHCTEWFQSASDLQVHIHCCSCSWRHPMFTISFVCFGD
jgi:hypothetical protein